MKGILKHKIDKLKTIILNQSSHILTVQQVCEALNTSAIVIRTSTHKKEEGEKLSCNRLCYEQFA